MKELVLRQASYFIYMIESKFKYFPDYLIQIIPTEMISLIAPLRYMYMCVWVYIDGEWDRGRGRESRQYCWLFRDIGFQSDYLSSNPSSAIFAMTLDKLCVLFTFHNKKIKLLNTCKCSEDCPAHEKYSEYTVIIPTLLKHLQCLRELRFCTRQIIHEWKF